MHAKSCPNMHGSLPMALSTVTGLCRRWELTLRMRLAAESSRIPPTAAQTTNNRVLLRLPGPGTVRRASQKITKPVLLLHLPILGRDWSGRKSIVGGRGSTTHSLLSAEELREKVVFTRDNDTVNRQGLFDGVCDPADIPQQSIWKGANWNAAERAVIRLILRRS